MTPSEYVESLLKELRSNTTKLARAQAKVAQAEFEIERIEKSMKEKRDAKQRATNELLQAELAFSESVRSLVIEGVDINEL